MHNGIWVFPEKGEKPLLYIYAMKLLVFTRKCLIFTSLKQFKVKLHHHVNWKKKELVENQFGTTAS